MHKKFLHISVLIACAMMVSSCASDLKEYFGRHGPFTPAPFLIGDMPDGDDDYSQGFRDGCNTSHSIIGTALMSATYDDIYYDVEKSIKSDEYYKGRTIGHNYCNYYNDTNPI